MAALALAGCRTSSPPPPPGPPRYLGSQACGRCHQQAYQDWLGSHHQKAMARPEPGNVLGDFSGVTLEHHGVRTRFFRQGADYLVETVGPDGRPGSWPIRYTFGWEPLQQYLVELPGGRLQALNVAWDSRAREQGGQRWFHLYPELGVGPSHPLFWAGPAQNWNHACAACHSTDLHKNFDLGTGTFETRFSELSVGCEACHGPGSAHQQWAQAGARGADPLPVVFPRPTTWVSDPETGSPHPHPVDDTELAVCARCHSHRVQLAEVGPEAPFLDGFAPSLFDGGLYYPNGMLAGEAYEYGSFRQSRMHAAGVTCTDCHQAHSLTLRAEGDALCLQCHQAARFSGPGHSHHAAVSCLDCHMPARTFMVVDRRRNHNLRLPRPDLGEPNACTACHQDLPRARLTRAFRDWYPKLPPDSLQAFQSDDPAGLRRLAADARADAYLRAGALDRLAAEQQPPPQPGEDELLRLARARTGPVAVRAGLLDDPRLAVRMQAARSLAGSAGELSSEQAAQLERALADYLRAQMVNADRAESHLNLGNLRRDQGHHEQALEAYREAIRRNPQFLPAYLNLADTLMRLKRAEEARQALEQGLRANPQAAELSYALGMHWLEQGQVGSARPVLERAWSLDSDQSRYAYALALARYADRHPEQALQLLDAAVRRWPQDADLLGAAIAMRLERGQPARDLCLRYRKLRPDDPAGLQWLRRAEGR